MFATQNSLKLSVSPLSGWHANPLGFVCVCGGPNVVDKGYLKRTNLKCMPGLWFNCPLVLHLSRYIQSARNFCDI